MSIKRQRSLDTNHYSLNFPESKSTKSHHIPQLLALPREIRDIILRYAIDNSAPFKMQLQNALCLDLKRVAEDDFALAGKRIFWEIHYDKVQRSIAFARKFKINPARIYGVNERLCAAIDQAERFGGVVLGARDMKEDFAITPIFRVCHRSREEAMECFFSAKAFALDLPTASALDHDAKMILRLSQKLEISMDMELTEEVVSILSARTLLQTLILEVKTSKARPDLLSALFYLEKLKQVPVKGRAVLRVSTTTENGRSWSKLEKPCQDIEEAMMGKGKALKQQVESKLARLAL